MTTDRNRSDLTIRPVGYAPQNPTAAFECFPLHELRRRPDVDLGGLQRLRFDLVIACTAGQGQHDVDFVPTRLTPNRWLHIRPGQVHRWHPDGYEADLLLLAPVDRSPHWRAGPRVIELDDDQRHDIGPLLALARHRRRTIVAPEALGLVRELLVRWLALDQPDERDRTDVLYSDFRRLLAREVTRSRSVEHYARTLGCSSRTLSRVCHRAAGSAPKQLIDDAVVLEARRRLALPGATVTETAQALGFDEATNFTKFFKRVSGDTPTTWQADQHTPAERPASALIRPR